MTRPSSLLADPTAAGSTVQRFDVTYVKGIDTVADGELELVVDSKPTTLRFADACARGAAVATVKPGERV